MKFFWLLLIILFYVQATNYEALILTEWDENISKFKKFIDNFKKSYSSFKEYYERLQVFK